MKAYVKPELYYEHFELSKHIADCALEFKNSEKADECYASIDTDFNLGIEGNVFASTTTSGCAIELQIYCEFAGGTDFGNTFKS